MQTNICVLLALVGIAQAARYIIDSSCDSVPRNLNQPINATPAIVTGMKEALDMARNAFEAMTRFGTDSKVQEMLKAILGDDPIKFGQVQATFAALTVIDDNPVDLATTSDEWQQQATNMDVAIYCSFARYRDDPSNSARLINPTMDNAKILRGGIRDSYSQNYDLDNSEEVRPPKARTTDSHRFDAAAWMAAKAQDPSVWVTDPRFSIPRLRFSCQIDLATWYLDLQQGRGWPTLNHGLINTAMREDFIEQFLSEAPPGVQRTPVDAVQTLGWVLLHELTHTIQGGLLRDVPNKDSCYGWSCVTENKRADNSDTIATIGVALKLWRLGYWVSEDGYIYSIN